MIYIRSIPSSSQQDEKEKEKALKLGEKLLLIHRAQRENNIQQLKLQLEIEKLRSKLSKLEKEYYELGGTKYVPQKERKQKFLKG